MGWASRHVLSWRLSNTMDTSFCIEALDDALGWRTPEIFNTDQGSQFTSAAFADQVPAAELRFSMDGRGRFPRPHLHRTAVALAEVQGRLPARASRRTGGRRDHRLVDRLLQRGAPPLVPGRADAGRDLSRRHGGDVREGSSGTSRRALPRRRGTGGAWDVSPSSGVPRSPVSPRSAGGAPPADRGYIQSCPSPPPRRTPGRRTHPSGTHCECYRGLWKPAGGHLKLKFQR